MRQIDADALLVAISKVTVHPLHEVIQAICDAPTIDAVPVVRCRDCVLRSSIFFCGRHGHPVGADFFCAHGTTDAARKPRPAKKTEKKAEEICQATGRACSKCTPGPCDHRRTVIPDVSGQ